jgi:hypothetical protein
VAATKVAYQPKVDADEPPGPWHRVKIGIVVYTYGTGKTPEAALKEAERRVTAVPAFEGQVLEARILKEWVGERPLTYEQMIKDTGPEKWTT